MVLQASSGYVDGGADANHHGDNAFGAGPSSHGFQELQGFDDFDGFGSIDQAGNTQEAPSPYALPYPHTVSPDDGQNLAPSGYADNRLNSTHDPSEGSSKPDDSRKRSRPETQDEGMIGSTSTKKSEPKSARKGQVQGNGEHLEWKDPTTKGWSKSPALLNFQGYRSLTSNRARRETSRH